MLISAKVTFRNGDGNVHDMHPDDDQPMIKNKKTALSKLKKGLSKTAKENEIKLICEEQK
jgi:hypothetical protein